jgi:ArsR family transcriptional regulator, arsenate/arsenite/antimonite-responsive transcriptional repressor
MEMKSAVAALSALAHEGRLSVFRMLVQAGMEGLAAGEIARRLDVPPNTLSANLNILSHARLIASRRDGRSVIYTARYTSMTELLGFLLEDCCGGNPEICVPLVELVMNSRCCEEGQA